MALFGHPDGEQPPLYWRDDPTRGASWAAGRVPDPDREPRRRDPARARDARRGGRRGVRGHPPHRRLLERHGIRRPLVSYHEHNEARARRGAGRRASPTAQLVALVSDAGTPLVADPGHVLVQACIARGPGGRGAARAERGGDRAGGLRAAGASVALRRLPAAARGPSASSCWRGGERDGRRVRVPAAAGATLELLAEREPARALAVCRELSKLHEEVSPRNRRRAAPRFSGERPPRRDRARARPSGAARAARRARRGGARRPARAGRRRRAPAGGGAGRSRG